MLSLTDTRANERSKQLKADVIRNVEQQPVILYNSVIPRIGRIQMIPRISAGLFHRTADIVERAGGLGRKITERARASDIESEWRAGAHRRPRGDRFFLSRYCISACSPRNREIIFEGGYKANSRAHAL